MKRINEKYKLPVTPKANDKAIVMGDKYRFTVLTDRLIRMEYSESGVFEDRATQVVVNREFDVPAFDVVEDDEKIEIITEYMIVTYHKRGRFNVYTLGASFKGELSHANNDWYLGYGFSENLKGTIRTLDAIDGEVPLEPGLMCRDKFTLLDDSRSLALGEDGWIDRREEDCIDLYVFGYADNYYETLKAYYKLTGATPLLPRFALGNMWSRYHRYTQQEYLDLMDRFKEEGCPFSVAVIDMDWHLVHHDLRYGHGWTGYTWDKKLFPDYKEFLKELHKRDLEVTLNLHPADGVVPYEEMYPQMAEAMGVTDSTPVRFDITNPKFVENYFKILHNPYEKDGVSFWWMDWQQGCRTTYKNLDPLWMLNHFHMLDMKSNGKRPIMLSRYSQMGSHRYPIGFSGDTAITWESLNFQPYFTATASNVGYTWWSHDIGGHCNGIRDDELMARWVQLGVFSPINRLHSTQNPLLGKEPWNYDRDTEATMKKFLRLRHELIPYLYTMNYRTYKYSEPLVTPLYYNHPKLDDAYYPEYRNEFYFGNQMIVSPITKKSNAVTRTSYANTYIPAGKWHDFFNGRKYIGGKSLRLYRDLYDMPVLVKAGGIIPMSADGIKNSTKNPQNLKVRVFSGADNTFEMYEDDGISLSHENGAYAITKFEFYDKDKFVINAPTGDTSVLPETRNYEIEFNGYCSFTDFEVTSDGQKTDYEVKNLDGKTSVLVKDVKGELCIKFLSVPEEKQNNAEQDAIEVVRRYQGKNYPMKIVLYNMIAAHSSLEKILICLNKYNADENITHSLIEILSADK